MTRGQFLRAAGVATGVAALGAGAYGVSTLLDGETPSPTPQRVLRFRSRPDLRPPGLRVAQLAGQARPGDPAIPELLMLGPSPKGAAHGPAQAGALLADGGGEPIWFLPAGHGEAVSNLRVSRFRGEPVLTWWVGKIVPTGYGSGVGRIVDARYRTVATVRAGNGRSADLHELTLTPEGTALICCYPQPVEADLRAVGGPARGHALQNIIQEVDLRTGRVLLDWRSLEHIPVSESYRPHAEPYDYLHANSIDVTPDGHLLVSGRHTWTIYKLHRRTGEVIWRLGGKRSDFRFDPAARFSWQHDARQLSPRTLTLFDNGSDGPTRTERQSRALVLDVDSAAREVRLTRALNHPRHPLLSAAMGNVQTLADGRLLVGWGIEPHTTEFGGGTPLADVRMPRGWYSYRAFRFPWEGRPAEAPAIALAADRRTAFASWNGATQVARWQLRAGADRNALRAVATVPRAGFETPIPVPGAPRVVSVAALDRSGRVLSASEPVRA